MQGPEVLDVLRADAQAQAPLDRRKHVPDAHASFPSAPNIFTWHSGEGLPLGSRNRRLDGAGSPSPTANGSLIRAPPSS